jgi:O-antigen ligase
LLVPQKVRFRESGSQSGGAHPDSFLMRATVVMPALFVAICLALGGSSRHGLLTNALLELISVLFLLGIAFSSGFTNPFRLLAGLAWLFAGAVALFTLHLFPWPPSIWTDLPGRDFVAEGYQMLGLPLPALPFSLDPGRARASLLALLPIACALLLVLRAGSNSYLPLALTIVVVALLSLLIGIAQAIGGPDSPLYFYSSASREGAKGFFANSNHLATLFLACVPLLAAFVVEIRRTKGDISLGARAASILILMCLALGIFIAGSVAGVMLLIPVLGASAFILKPRSRGSRWLIGLMLLAIVGASAGTVALSSRAPDLRTSLGDADLDRIGIARTSWKLAKTYWPVGSGIGSFQQVYQLHEKPDNITNVYVNHAHNEYLEILIEAGLPGALLLLAFGAWGAQRTWIAWRLDGRDAHWKRAASIVLAVVAAHSLIDYPARTLAILAVVAACCAMLGRSQAGEP